MKRLLISVLVLGIAASVFAGGAKQEAQSGGGSGVTTIKWAMWDYDLTVYYKPLIDAYQAKNPQVKIEPVDLGSADFMTVLGTQLSGGADLDVLCIKDIPGYANLVRQNRLEPLAGFIKAKGIDTAQYSGVVEQLTVNGEVYALPFRRDFWLIFYNKDLFDAAGVPYPSNDLTLDDYDALARKVTRGSGANKTYGAHYHTWRSTIQLFGLLDGKNTIVDGKYDFLAPYYERVLKEQSDGIVQSYATLKTSGTHYSGAFFNSQIAMMNMGTWFISTQIDKVKIGESTSKNWGLAKYPHPAGVPAGTTLASVTGIAVNKNSKNKEAALAFTQFLSGPEGAAILAKIGTIPAIMNQEVINAIASIPGFPSDPGSKEALQVAKTYLEMPLHEKSADIEIVLNEVHDAVMTGNTTVQAGIQEMNERVGKILGR
ncbi:MAG: sugar ABC transporter substrate-binding protein [Spirochaetaceae bacterium]|jgi:multiple sugar transport system substrate-binding protein|nr:sugar ABC transporter substrate-binding protein [Spirochaetaceae bacterium]